MAEDSKLTPAAQAALGHCWTIIMFRGSCHMQLCRCWPGMVAPALEAPKSLCHPYCTHATEGLVQISPCPDLWRYTFSGT